MPQGRLSMNEYIKLAEELEAYVGSEEITLDKVAAAALTYESFAVNDEFASDECLAKIASSTIVESDLALEIGVGIGIDALLNMEV